MENGSVPVRAGGLPAGWAAGAVDLGAGDRVSVPLEPPAPATGQSPAAAPGSPDSPFRGRRAGRMRQAIRHGLLPIAGRLALAYLALTAVWAGLGLLLTGALAGTWVGPLDREVAGWLVGRRTPPLDGWSQVGSMLAETMVKVIVTAVIAVVMLLVWRSWHEPFLVSVALILEAAVFITVTSLVARPRPDVPALDEVSVGTSFPSGHAAAAAAYGAIAIVIFEHTRNTWIRTITIALVAAVPIIFGISRMYRVCTTSPT
ncbi:MAG TPA: phosphatase PAP2 family protein [Nakamurella sp.]